MFVLKNSKFIYITSGKLCRYNIFGKKKNKYVKKKIITFAMKLCSYVILNLCKLLNLMFALPNSKFK